MPRECLRLRLRRRHPLLLRLLHRCHVLLLQHAHREQLSAPHRERRSFVNEGGTCCSSCAAFCASARAISSFNGWPGISMTVKTRALHQSTSPPCKHHICKSDDSLTLSHSELAHLPVSMVIHLPQILSTDLWVYGSMWVYSVPGGTLASCYASLCRTDCGTDAAHSPRDNSACAAPDCTQNEPEINSKTDPKVADMRPKLGRYCRKLSENGRKWAHLVVILVGGDVQPDISELHPEDGEVRNPDRAAEDQQDEGRGDATASGSARCNPCGVGAVPSVSPIMRPKQTRMRPGE